MSEFEPSSPLPPVAGVVDRRRFLPRVAAGKRVVHLGCVDEHLTESRFGTGALLHEQLMHNAKELVGVDISASGLQLLRELLPGNYVEGDVHRLNALELPESCDLVLAPEIIEHLEAPGVFLDELRRYLVRSGATAIITTPNSYSWTHNVRFALRRREWVHPDHRVVYSPRTLLRSLELADLRCTNLYVHAWKRERRGLRGLLGLVDRGILAWNPLLGIGLVAEVDAAPS